MESSHNVGKIPLLDAVDGDVEMNDGSNNENQPQEQTLGGASDLSALALLTEPELTDDTVHLGAAGYDEQPSDKHEEILCHQFKPTLEDDEREDYLVISFKDDTDSSFKDDIDSRFSNSVPLDFQNPSGVRNRSKTFSTSTRVSSRNRSGSFKERFVGLFRKKRSISCPSSAAISVSSQDLYEHQSTVSSSEEGELDYTDNADNIGQHETRACLQNPQQDGSQESLLLDQSGSEQEERAENTTGSAQEMAYEQTTQDVSSTVDNIQNVKHMTYTEAQVLEQNSQDDSMLDIANTMNVDTITQGHELYTNLQEPGVGCSADAMRDDTYSNEQDTSDDSGNTFSEESFSKESPDSGMEVAVCTKETETNISEDLIQKPEVGYCADAMSDDIYSNEEETSDASGSSFIQVNSSEQSSDVGIDFTGSNEETEMDISQDLKHFAETTHNELPVIESSSGVQEKNRSESLQPVAETDDLDCPSKDLLNDTNQHNTENLLTLEPPLNTENIFCRLLKFLNQDSFFSHLWGHFRRLWEYFTDTPVLQQGIYGDI